MTSFIDSLISYNALQRLLLDNNKLNDAGAKSLALALPHMKLFDLNIGFNDIGAEGLLSIISCLLHPGCTINSITLSGNIIDNTVAKELANMLLINCRLCELFVDRTNLSNIGERLIATGIASNKASSLRTLTGFELGKVLTSIGSPTHVNAMNNEQALRYLAQAWRDLERTAMINMRVNQQPLLYVPVPVQPGLAGNLSLGQNMATMGAGNYYITPNFGVPSNGTSSPSELSISEAESQAPGSHYLHPVSFNTSRPTPPNYQSSVNQSNTPVSRRGRGKSNRLPPPTAQQQIPTQQQQSQSMFALPQPQQVYYTTSPYPCNFSSAKPAEQYAMLVDAIRQLKDLPFDGREWQELHAFFYSPPNHDSNIDGIHSVSTSPSPTAAANVITESSTPREIEKQDEIDATTQTHTKAKSPRRLGSSKRSQNESEATDGTCKKLSADNSAEYVTQETATNDKKLSIHFINGNQSTSTASAPAPGIVVHERPNSEESPRPLKRASNINTVPRINYFPRLKVSRSSICHFK
jgi:hypothetical protein